MHPGSPESVAQRIWEWLPARRMKRRVTTEVVCAAALDLDVRLVSETVHQLEARGHVIRDTYGMHRGTPIGGRR